MIYLYLHAYCASSNNTDQYQIKHKKKETNTQNSVFKFTRISNSHKTIPSHFHIDRLKTIEQSPHSGTQNANINSRYLVYKFHTALEE